MTRAASHFARAASHAVRPLLALVLAVILPGTGSAGEIECGRAQFITYRLVGRFKLSETALGTCDGEWPLPGSAMRAGGTPAVGARGPNLVLRVDEDGKRAAIVSFELPQNVHQEAVGNDVYTNVLHFVPTQIRGAATGTIVGTTLLWDICVTPPSYGTKRWASSELATGPGCLANFGDSGNIWCSGWACGLGNLKTGDNPVTRPPVWNQPLSSFKFDGSDLKNFTTDFFDVPNDRKSARTQLSLRGTEVKRTVETTPDCACRGGS